MPITYANIEKARRLLGYNPVTKIETGIEKFIEWFSKNSGPSIRAARHGIR